jgi:hypothetical protein
MKNVANTIEDLLEILAGLQGQSKLQIDPNDATIMHSVARQTFKGTALTDRQYNLMKEKLANYKLQFTALDYDFDRSVDSLRQPLRHIDRSKYVKIVSTAEVYGATKVYESYKQNWKWIEVRFPFAKKLITKIHSMANVRDYYHEKGSHRHFFKLNEKNTLNVIEAFKDSEFQIDEELLEFYDKIKLIQSCEDSYIPSIVNNELKNLNPRAVELAQDEIGLLDKETLIKYIDRRNRYGIVNFEQPVLAGRLSEKIALRTKSDMLFKPSEYRLDEVLSAVEELDRYPILVILDENHADEQLYKIYNFYKDFLPAEQQSVLFRLDSERNNEFNQMVKEFKLNNWVDKNTKVVYISNNKVPKVLFKSDFEPITAFAFDSRPNRNIDNFINNRCDLIVFYDEELSPIRRYSRKY